ncbi:RING finger protein 223 [Salmo trutta]|uniref:RING finger protein 223 n=1 Tax=Salmo trutta TaxID=8032 RepID=UPI001131EAE4|nr:RING finger protein 223-like [Salmo trutta]XP_029573874.1 RING finger protein 223-like [Salmo trutta]
MDPYQEPQLSFQPPRDEGAPDLECAICFSQFNNVFRTPKMLQCNHTFCLECLARMNVKSAKPDSIQCPLCRGHTPLPDLGLPKLTTDRAVISYLPTTMQRVYSIRFNRDKGKLQVKRTTDAPPPLNSLRSISHSLDVGLPSPPGGSGDVEGGQRRRLGALLRLCHRPGCRASLLVSVVMMMVVLTCVIIFLLAYKQL